MQDEQIVELYWARNEEAIHETANKYEAYLMKIANNILFELQDTRECVNDTYLRAWNSMPTHRPAVLSSYLGKIARELGIDCYRKRTSQKRGGSEYALSLDELEDCFAGGSTPEQGLEAKALAEAVNRFLRTLPEDTRNLFLLRYTFFDPLKEAAARCGMTEAKAKTVLFRTRQSLKEFLKEEGFDL